MNRDRLEREMSLNLDGRLSSARREQLLAHLEDDAEARRLWAEMEAAQSLAMSLEEESVGPTFSDTLWDRIRSGEGTPPAVFHEPVSLWSKARYVATGAAAAAVLLVGSQFLFATPGNDSGGDAERVDSVAAATAASSANETARDERADLRGDVEVPAPLRSVITPQLVGINPLSIAQASQYSCVSAVADLKHRLREVEPELPAKQPRDLLIRLRPQLEQARGSIELMRWLQRDNIVLLPGEFEAALSLTETAVGQLERAERDNARPALLGAVDNLRVVDTEPLRQRFEVICCPDPQEFANRLSTQLCSFPQSARAVRIVIADGDRMGGTRFELSLGVTGRSPLEDAMVLLESVQISERAPRYVPKPARPGSLGVPLHAK